MRTKNLLSIQDELIKAYSVKDLAALVDKYGQAAVDESIGLLRVEDFILDNATVEEKVSAGDTQGVNGDDPSSDGSSAEGTVMKSWKRQRLQIWCRKTARRIRMQRVRSDLTVLAAKKSVVPGMCFGCHFFYMCIAKCVTENEVNSNKLRDSFGNFHCI